MHYVDEGQGPAIVFVHGTPDWSFVWRHLIKALSPQYRCIAPDNLGFGLSDKPRDASYAPAEQAANLRQLIEHLGLRDVALVLHDFGGPFGLSYALDSPANVKSLVLLNTWMWSLRGDPHYERFGRLFGGALGRFLYLRLNFPVRVIMKHAILDRTRFPRRIQKQYARPFGSAAERVATHAYARALLGAGEWYNGLWRRRERIHDIPALIPSPPGGDEGDLDGVDGARAHEGTRELDLAEVLRPMGEADGAQRAHRVHLAERPDRHHAVEQR